MFERTIIMKKITLLLIPALLAVTGCKTTPITPSISSESSLSSTTELPPEPEYPTPEELLANFRKANFTLAIKIEDYNDGELGFYNSFRTLYDSNKVEFKKHTPLVTTAYGIKHGDIIDSYYLVRNNWVLVEDYVTNDTSSAYGVFDSIDMAFADITVGALCHWSFDAENYIYHAESKTTSEPFYLDVSLSKDFFSEILCTIKDGDYIRYMTITPTNYGRTRITLPDTPCNTIFDTLKEVGPTMRSLNSFDLTYVEMDAVSSEIFLQNHYVVKKVLEEKTIYVQVKTAEDTVLYRDRWDDNDEHVYHKTPFGREDWEEISYSTYLEATDTAFIGDNVDLYPDVDSFAYYVTNVGTVSDSELEFTMKYGDEHVSDLIIFIDPSTHWVESASNTEDGVKHLYNYRNYNSVTLDV